MAKHTEDVEEIDNATFGDSVIAGKADSYDAEGMEGMEETGEDEINPLDFGEDQYAF
jgi:hypothetical protein